MDDRNRERLGDEADRAHLNGEGQNMDDRLRPELAAHLAEDAVSPEELRELQATVALLGSLPQVAPRRTFILTPEQVAASGGPRAPRRRAWVWPVRWATALAALCFAVTIGLDFRTPAAVPLASPSPTAIVAAATATSDGLPQITALGTATYIEPVPTVAPPVIVTTPTPTPVARTDWRPAQIATGALAAIGAVFGFLLPPFLRRRDTTPA